MNSTIYKKNEDERSFNLILENNKRKKYEGKEINIRNLHEDIGWELWRAPVIQLLGDQSWWTV